MRGKEIVRTHRPLSRDGVYTIYPDLKTNRTVFCDMTTDGGGWTVSLTSWRRENFMLRKQCIRVTSRHQLQLSDENKSPNLKQNYIIFLQDH